MAKKVDFIDRTKLNEVGSSLLNGVGSTSAFRSISLCAKVEGGEDFDRCVFDCLILFRRYLKRKPREIERNRNNPMPTPMPMYNFLYLEVDLGLGGRAEPVVDGIPLEPAELLATKGGALVV